jgi:hypothetical protein
MRLAVFTLVRNDVFLPVWLHHYMQHVPAEDIYVLDHESMGDALDELHGLQGMYHFNLLRVQHRWTYDTLWMARLTRDFQTFLLRTYSAVLFSAADELVTPRPEYAGKLPEFADEFLADVNYLRCNGFDVVHKHDEEPTLDLTQRILPQRNWWYHNQRYSKPLLSMIPLYWQRGWFGAANVPALEPIFRDLLLIHLHKVDLQLCIERHQLNASQNWLGEEKVGPLAHNLLEDPEQLSRWILSNSDDSSQYATLARIPDSLKERWPCRSIK